MKKALELYILQQYDQFFLNEENKMMLRILSVLKQNNFIHRMMHDLKSHL